KEPTGFFQMVDRLKKENEEASSRVDFPLELPFVVVEGSSGKGKTQFAFTLPNCLYFLPKKMFFHAQEIYIAFNSFSALLYECCSKDVRTIQPWNDPKDPRLNAHELQKDILLGVP